MHTIKIEVEDSKIDIVLTILKNLKENIVSKYEVIDNNEEKSFINISEKQFGMIWDNSEDDVYDKFLKT